MRGRLIVWAVLLALGAPSSLLAEGRRVIVVPLGDPPDAIVETAAEALRGRFHFDVEVSTAVPLPRNAWYAPRKRWRAEKLLTFLAALDYGPNWKVVGITDRPISTTKGARYDWGIAGLATLDGRASVLTTYLFRGVRAKAPRTFDRYVENLVLHEVGHSLGADHCVLDRCIMADAKGNALRAARLSTNEFCPVCWKKMRTWLRAEAPVGAWTEADVAAAERGFPDGVSPWAGGRAPRRDAPPPASPSSSPPR